jgi:hypothetical protein
MKDLDEEIALQLLGEWLAIQDGKTRLEGKDYLEDAQELADYLTLIGYRLSKKVEEG